jgi:hypothetical protein
MMMFKPMFYPRFFLCLALFMMSGKNSVAEPIALYRLIHLKSSNHLYTTDCNERISVQTQKEYGMEGIAGYVENQKISDSVPLFRLWNGTHHFYTADSGERNKNINEGYSDEGVVGYVSTTPGEGKTKLYRLYNPKSGDHFYTIHDTELQNAVMQFGYNHEGDVGYIWTSGTKCTGQDRIAFPHYRCICYSNIGPDGSSTEAYSGRTCNQFECDRKCKQLYGFNFRFAACQKSPLSP